MIQIFLALLLTQSVSSSDEIKSQLLCAVKSASCSQTDVQPANKYVSAGCTSECSDAGLAFCRQEMLTKTGFSNDCQGLSGCPDVGGTCRVMKIVDGGGNATLKWVPPLDTDPSTKHKLCLECPSQGLCSWAPAYSCGCDSTIAKTVPAVPVEGDGTSKD